MKQRQDRQPPPPRDESEYDFSWTSWIRGRQNRWQQVTEKFWRVPAEVKNERYRICRECEEFISLSTQCRLCFCAMGIKTWYAGFSCPKGKWHAVTPPGGDTERS